MQIHHLQDKAPRKPHPQDLISLFYYFFPVCAFANILVHGCHLKITFFCNLVHNFLDIAFPSCCSDNLCPFFNKRAFEDSSQNALWQYIMEYFSDRYAQEAKRILGTDTLEKQIQFSIRLYCYGTVGITREWLLTDNITPAQTIVQMMFMSTPEPLKSIYFK
ncbi:TetR-like C-terminal domain-containing protein [Butyrivibrio sp. XBB1001]|uniref:TetR-like C-terminal domain-containing protein n=1 Tax=Butyrivibrio sp. XBB1001 TaxID=1280682 RepID=UPI0018CAED9B